MINQLSLISDCDLDPASQHETLFVKGFRCVLTYLDKKIAYPDIGCGGWQTSHYKSIGGYVYRIFSESGLLVENKNPEPSKDVALACIDIEIRILLGNGITP